MHRLCFLLPPPATTPPLFRFQILAAHPSLSAQARGLREFLELLRSPTGLKIAQGLSSVTSEEDPLSDVQGFEFRAQLLTLLLHARSRTNRAEAVQVLCVCALA